MKLLIVDDEEPARLRLRALLQALPELDATVVGEAGDAAAATALLQTTPADALLLDIGLPGRSGLQLAEALRALPSPPALIFVTAHENHALRAFELEAVDYLTKPVRRERLLSALQRVQSRLAAGTTGHAPAALVINDRGRVLRLPLSEVLYLKAELKYVTLRTAAHSHVLDDTLSELEPRLAAMGGEFVRIHRNALVARHAIRELALRPDDAGVEAGWAVRVAPLDEWLSVSRRQAAAVRATLAGGDAPG